MEEEKRKAKRIISKQDLMIKALEKQLEDERSLRGEIEKTNAEMKKQMAEMEGNYREEVCIPFSSFIFLPLRKYLFTN